MTGRPDEGRQVEPSTTGVDQDGGLSSGTPPESRAARHRGQPSPPLTPRSVYWYLTKAPRRRLTDPNQDVVRPALGIFAVTMGAFGVAAHDFMTQSPWYIPLRGLAALLGGLFLIWAVIAYLGRPPSVSKPSLAAKARQWHPSRTHDTDEEDG